MRERVCVVVVARLLLLPSTLSVVVVNEEDANPECELFVTIRNGQTTSRKLSYIGKGAPTRSSEQGDEEKGEQEEERMTGW